MPTKKRATSRRELIEPTKGDKHYVRRNAKGEFNKVVDVGKSLASDKRTTAKKKVPKGQGDRGRYEAVNRAVPSIPAVLDNAGIAELLIREAETATGHRERALQRAAHATFMWPEEVRRCAANPDSGAGAQSSRQKSTMAGTATVTCKCTPSSDGGGTISEMAAAAIERGYKFIAITDHTKV